MMNLLPLSKISVQSGNKLSSPSHLAFTNHMTHTTHAHNHMSLPESLSPYNTINDDMFVEMNQGELKLILQNIETGIIAQNLQGKLLYANESAAKFLGFPNVHALISHNKNNHTLLNITECIYTDQCQKKLAPNRFPWQDAQHDSNQTRELTIVVTDKISQDSRRIHIKSNLVRNTDLHTPVIMSILTDVSSTAQLEKQKDEFMSMASHELKTPITSMKVFTQVLQRNFSEGKDPKPLYYLGKIDGQLNKLTLLIKEILDVSRIQAGKLALHKEVFSVKDVLSEVGQHMQYTTDKHTIAIDNTYQGMLYADKERFIQVLVNLLSNAIKYSPNNKTIQVRSKESHGHLLISVQDQGIGISKKHQKHIFDRFAQATDNKEESTFPGMGVGLYIASQMIQRHNGLLSVQSKVNQGSTFTIDLPILQNNES